MNEQENTLRALSDQPLLATGRWCWIGLHKWTMYSKPMHRREGGYDIEYQARTCSHCGIIDVKQLRKY